MDKIVNRSALALIIFVIGASAISFRAVGQQRDVNQKARALDTSFYNVPEFYFYPKYNKDTVLIFRCYDKQDSLMTDVEDYDKVRYYSLFKEYTDSAHTYKDKNGERQYLPISVIVKRYDRLGKSKWMCIAYPGNRYTELKEDRSESVGSTMVMIDRTGDGIADWVKVYNYYKCSPVK